MAIGKKKRAKDAAPPDVGAALGDESQQSFGCPVADDSGKSNRSRRQDSSGIGGGGGGDNTTVSARGGIARAMHEKARRRLVEEGSARHSAHVKYWQRMIQIYTDSRHT